MAARDNLSQHLFGPPTGSAQTGPSSSSSSSWSSSSSSTSTPARSNPPHGGLFDPSAYDVAPPASSGTVETRSPAHRPLQRMVGVDGKTPKWVHHQGNPEPLKMFMSANEILGQYQPLDADREDSYGGGSYQSPGTYSSGSFDARAGDKTAHSRTTGNNSWGGPGRTNSERPVSPKWDTTQTATSPGGEAAHPYRRHANRTGDWHSGQYHVGTGGGTESDSELWDRKYHESEGRGLVDSIVDEGVHSPVRLGSATGSQGLPEIVGGHHRLSVMQFNKPDELMPVLHYEGGIQDARRGMPYNSRPVAPLPLDKPNRRDGYSYT